MDTIIVKKKWGRKRILSIVGAAGVIMLIVTAFLTGQGRNALNVDKEKIMVSEIKQGVFQENIPVNGVVLPHTSIYLDAQEGGRVEEKYVEDGTVLKKGDPVIRLSNTDLLMTMMGQQSVVYNTLTQMQINRNSAQQNTVSKLNQVADVESQLTEAERIYDLNKKLFEQQVIGLQEYQKSKNDYQYALTKKTLARRILEQDSLSVNKQLAQDRQSYKASENALDMMQKKVGDLIVRSPVDGQLTSLDAEVGQNKNKGDRIGQIDMLGGFKIRADIDEHYISRIYPGLKAGFDFAGSNYQLKIRKVYTQVTAGRFQVDMEFEGKGPNGIRRGQTLQLLLALSDERKAILLPKGGFFQQTGGNWIFKLSEDGKTARKVTIQTGNQNTEYYEVLDGIKEGDKVVTSSYDNFGTMDQLILK